ncbi:MAG: CobW-like GTP-binding protein [Chloroflexi bacterium]|nr:CobW-like GTP-binding protein [Chloroflexota bacterium]
MHFHLVGGFLGSGKTTAIIGAARILMAQDKRVGIVTNDQGKYLVDTAFFRAQDFPTVEVTGGCFCCNYDDLEARLKQLQASTWPDVIFAESVGSCADIVATIVKPFLDLQTAGIPLTSYTVFTDVRLLRRRLSNQPMPFGDDVVYIYDKQIEEAGLLIINKVDLLSAADMQATHALAQTTFPGKALRLQNSRNASDVEHWAQLIETDPTLVPQTSIEIDYNRYGAGEAELAWLDEAITLHTPSRRLRAGIVALVTAIRSTILDQQLPIGHVKFLVETPSHGAKISLPSIEEPGWEQDIPALEGDNARVLINARVQTDAQALRTLVKAAIQQAASTCGGSVTELEVDSFHPGFPRPTHRIS